MYHRKHMLKALTSLSLLGLLITAESLQARPQILQPMPDLARSHGFPTPIAIDLNTYFESDVPLPLTSQLTDNSNPSIASASVSGRTLTLTMSPGQVGTDHY